MKKTIIIYDKDGAKEKEINYIPVRFIIALLLIVLETATVIAITILCAIYIPYFYLAMYATEIFCVLKIINSEENPDYKIPWLLLTLLVPVAGFMIYFMFYDRRLTKKQMKRINESLHSRYIPTIQKYWQSLKRLTKRHTCRQICYVIWHQHTSIKIPMPSIMIWAKSFLSRCLKT